MLHFVCEFREPGGAGKRRGNPDTNPFPRRRHPRYPTSMHSRIDNKGARPRAMGPHNPRLFSYQHPRLQIPVVSSPRKRLETKRIQPAEGLGVGAPPSFQRKPESEAWGGVRRVPRQGTRDAPPLRHSCGGRNPEGVEEAGHTLTPTPFPDDTVPATLSPCTAAPTTRRPPPKAKRPHNPRLFPYLHPPTPDRVVSSRRKKLETKRIQPAERLGRGAPPSHHSFEGREPRDGRSGRRSRRGLRNGASVAAYRGGAWNRPWYPSLAGCASRKNATCRRRALRATVKPPG